MQDFRDLVRNHGRRNTVGAIGLAAALLVPAACYSGLEGDELGIDDEGDTEVELDVEPIGPNSTAVCAPTMSLFPVAAPHNIGYDGGSCGGPNGCAVSCPDSNANSDWNPATTHNGIDIFAHEGAPLVAVADGEVVGSGTVSDTSGIRVKIRDACGWSYYYGHLRSAAVSKGQHVRAGDIIGTMGHTGTHSTHLHFNVSPAGYLDDIDPFELLVSTSPTACGAAPELPPDDSGGGSVEPQPPAPEPPPPGTCGVMVDGDALGVDGALTSCDGRFSLVMQGDGNVVLYQHGSAGALWHAGTVGRGGTVLAMQGDGNLVLYTDGGAPVWHTQTHGRPGAYLQLDDAGALILFDGGQPVWWSGTGGL